jgi:hypothetical protein
VLGEELAELGDRDPRIVMERAPADHPQREYGVRIR